MTPERWQRIKDIFQAALDRAPEERAAFFERACRGDESLLVEIRALVASTGGSNFPGEPSFDLFADAISIPVKGRLIGPYRIIREINAGGMGEVFEAEQEMPIHRRVALKLIRRGLDTSRVIARFESERQSLALMSHPNIAQVFDAGATEDGRPYFAMEYVPGEPITLHCDAHRLNVRERLELFKQVCDGVQHAHQKRIIHRDLKPSNVLVTSMGDNPYPKIIDFGIAKAIDRPLETEYGQKLGTPGYMSPEQAAGRDDIDTRTDIYSLGVLLYELLTSELPHTSAEVEQEIPTPSVKLAQNERASTAANRRTEMAALIRQIRGDLDWIAMKALEDDRELRYATPSALAVDIERHLSNEPVLASPPNKAYRLKKFLSRHRIGVAAAALVILALVAGVTLASIGFIRARRSEKVARQEASRANREAETSRRVSTFLIDMFGALEPNKAQGGAVPVREVLDVGVRQISIGLGKQPEVRAAVMDAMGGAYFSLGLYDDAEPLLQQSLKIRRQVLGPVHPDVAASLKHLAEVHRARGKYGEASALHHQALIIREQTLGAEHPETADSLNDLGVLYLNLGKYKEAESSFRRAQRIWKMTRDPRNVTALSHLALLYRDMGKYDKALPLFEAVLAIQQKTLPPEHTEIGANLNNLADIYRSIGQYSKAEALLRRVVEVNEKVMGPEHPIVATCLSNLAMVYRVQGKYRQAEKLYQRTLKIDLKAKGPEHPDIAIDFHNLGVLYREEGRYAEAESLLLRALKMREKLLGPRHPQVGGSLNHLGLLYAAQNRYVLAESYYNRSLALREEALGPKHPHVAITLTNLANLYRDHNKYKQAELLLRRALAIWEELPIPNAEDMAATLESYVDVLRKMGRTAEANQMNSRARSLQKRLAN
jgi:serine/threonine protein kinase/tetratricopeptide (TPR) repeat protein